MNSPVQSDRQNLTAVLVFSGLLAAPAAVFAEASWYGSLRGGVMLDKGKDAKYYDGGSRWGIKGSNEISEGLTAVYNFEHAFSTEDAGLDSGGTKGRLAYVGLSGGFGALTLGQIWSASYNHTGVIRDISNWHSAHESSGRVGNALSYAYTGDAFSVQFDAIMAGGKDTGKAVDQWELGATVNIGDIGKVAFAHVKKEDQMMDMMTPATVTINVVSNAVQAAENGKTTLFPKKVKVWVKAKVGGTGADKDNKGKFNDADLDSANDRKNLRADSTKSLSAINIHALRMANKPIGDPDNYWFFVNDASEKTGVAYDCLTADSKISDKCVGIDIYAQFTGDPTNAGKNYFLPNEPGVTAAGTKKVISEYGGKSSHVSASFDVGAVTLGLGHSTTKSMDPMKTKKSKTNYIGASGGIGDTGLSWNAWYRTKEAYDADSGKMEKTKPWTIGLKKTLGGGAWAYVEHGNNGKKGTEKKGNTVVGLGVNF